MGQYTVYNESCIDSYITSKLNSIVETIRKDITQVDSIILTGSFARGEGSIIVFNNNIRFLKDFDFLVITDNFPSSRTVELMTRKIYRKMNLENAESKIFRFSKFVIDVKFMKKKDLNYPDIWFCDLKYNGRILFGEDVRELISYDTKDVPLSSGLRLLFEKTTGLIGHFNYKYIYNPNGGTERREFLVYECLKTYVEIATSLCILFRQYRPTYRQRLSIVEELLKNEAKELSNQVPSLYEKLEYATRFKLKPEFEAISSPIDLWFNARDDLEKVLKYYIKKYTGQEISDWKEVSKIRKILSCIYFRPMLDAWMINKFKVKIFAYLLNLLYHLLADIEYIINIKKQYGVFYLQPLSRLASPSLTFFLAAPLILYSVKKDGSIREDYISKALKELRHCIPILHSKDNAWDMARENYLRAYKIYAGRHMIK